MSVTNKGNVMQDLIWLAGLAALYLAVRGLLRVYATTSQGVAR